jgi:hypothetical protein
MKKQHKPDEYNKTIENIVKTVQVEMHLAEIQSEEALVQYIETESKFTDASEAFAFFNDHAPYEWDEYINEEALQQHEFDLEKLVIEVVNSALSIDIFRKLQNTAGYEFLIGEPQLISIKLDNGDKVLLKEHWKIKSCEYDGFPCAIIGDVDGKVLNKYQENESSIPVYDLEHNDPTLVYISEKIIPKPDHSVEHYEALKVEKLKSFGCPESELWLTEVQTIEAFEVLYGNDNYDPISEFDLHEYFYVVYHHQDGEVTVVAGFNTYDEFELGCEHIANFIK